MSEQGDNDEAVAAVYQHAASLVRDGKSRDQVKADLLSQGLDEESAGIVTRNIFEMRKKAYSEEGRKNMLHGALWCIGGIVVTAVTYSAARGGGTYVVTWGAIIFGAVQFFRGVGQLNGGD